MLNIFYGRESIDKEKFIFEQIGKSKKPCLVIVPDQYTLEGEKQALRFLGGSCLLNVEIISLSRLGNRVLAKTGGARGEFLDKYGRHMLLVSIINDIADNLEVFAVSARKPDFLELANNFISQLKQYDIVPEDLDSLEKTLDSDSLLAGKLRDFYKIYSIYEERIAGKFTDSEDLIERYLEKINEWDYLDGKDIWVYGYDSFAPKAMRMLGKLLAKADNLNIFLTFDDKAGDRDLFTLTGIVRNGLIDIAREYEIDWHISEISQDEYKVNRSNGIASLEQELYSITRHAGRDFDGIRVLKAANIYSEAESAASYITSLVRDKGFRYRDIVVICNDQQVRASAIKRVFEEWGIRVFDDKKRVLMNHPVAILIVSMLEAVTGKYGKDSLFAALKTGLFDSASGDIEDLENYSIKYRIRGTMWKKDFLKGAKEYGDDGFEHINTVRRETMSVFEELEAICKDADTTDEFVRKYYEFLTERMNLAEKITGIIESQEELGLLEMAEETAQVWNGIAGLFDQIHQLCSGEKFNAKEFIELLSAGLSELEVGIIPQSSDEVLLGTMQRTRVGQTRATLVLGANEGLIPQDLSSQGIFAEDELELLNGNGKDLCKIENVRNMEEKLAIYRNLSKPSNYLYISYSASDEEGKELRPSEIIDSIMRVFPELKEDSDIVTRNEPLDFIGGTTSTICHLSEALGRARKGEKIPAVWKDVISWMEANRTDKISKLKDSLAFDNETGKLPASVVESLYKHEGDDVFSVSPSRLERFSRCPFAHFINYGLKPEERRNYEASSREIGDIYHECMMKITTKLRDENLWDSITEDECKVLIDQMLDGTLEGYREGVFDYISEDRYKAGRIKDTILQVLWALILQVRAGEVETSLFEAGFNRKPYAKIKPIEINTNGNKVFIEGIIDRVDYLKDDRVKIIDYKTGHESFSVDEAKGGYRLQLMLYLKAACENERKPAGVFYFRIAEKDIDATSLKYDELSEAVATAMKKKFKLDGVLLNDPEIITGVAGEFEGHSDIISVNHKKDGSYVGTPLLSEEEFEELINQVDLKIHELCNDYVSGRISISPKKVSDKASACTYCTFKGICRFDTEYKGCNYEMI